MDSVRVTPIFDKKQNKAKLIVSGNKRAHDIFDAALNAGKLEQDKVVIENYPGSPGFDAEKFQKMATPQLASTMERIRNKLNLPKLSLVDGVQNDLAAVGDALKVRLSSFLGIVKSEDKAVK